MDKNPYLTIMIQSLKKKSAVLDAIIELNIRQKEELENPGLDPDDFDACVEEKAKQIEQLELLDAGFQEVYDKIKADLQTNQQEYREEIAEMQEYIRRLTDKRSDDAEVCLCTQTGQGSAQEPEGRQSVLQEHDEVRLYGAAVYGQ